MDAVSPGPPSDPVSDMTVTILEHPELDGVGDYRASVGSSAGVQNQLASQVNSGGPARTSPSTDILQISIEVVVATILNRARILLLLGDREGAAGCLLHALHRSKHAPDARLQQKCEDLIREFKEHAELYEGSGLHLISPASAHSGVARLDFLKNLAKDPRAKIPDRLMELARNQNSASVSFRSYQSPSPPLPSATFTNVDLIPNSALLMDEIYEKIKNAPARRRPPGRHLARPQVENQLLDPTPVRNGALSKLSPNKIKDVQSSTLLIKRNLNHRRSSQAHPLTHTPTQQRPRASSVDEDVTTISPLPQRRTSMASNQKPPTNDESADAVLSTDTPSLTKLAEAMSANSSPHSDSSVKTALLLGIPTSISHTPPALRIYTSDAAASNAGLPEGTMPHHHSPLRETFPPEPDTSSDSAPAVDTEIKHDVDPMASDKIPNEAVDEPSHLEQTTSTAIALAQNEAIDLPTNNDDNADPSESVEHVIHNEIMTERDLLDAESIVRAVLHRLVRKTASGIVAGQLADHRLKKKIEAMKKGDPPQLQGQQPPSRPKSQFGSLSEAGMRPKWDHRAIEKWSEGVPSASREKEVVLDGPSRKRDQAAEDKLSKTTKEIHQETSPKSGEKQQTTVEEQVSRESTGRRQAPSWYETFEPVKQRIKQRQEEELKLEGDEADEDDVD